MLDESFRTCIRLPNLAFSPIKAQEPVVAQRVCVLLPCDPDTLGRLSLEALEAPGAHGQMHDVFTWPRSRITEQSGDLRAELQVLFLCALRDETGTWL